MRRSRGPKLPEDRVPLVDEHMGRAVAMGRRVAGPRLEASEAEGASYLALVEAAARYDGKRAFPAYLKCWVAKRVRLAIHDSRRVNTPHAYAPDRGDATGLVARAARMAVSLDAPDPETGRPRAGAAPAVESERPEPDDLETLRSRIAHLTPVERGVIERRYGLGGRPGETLAAIGGAGRTKQETARRIEVRAMKKLRRMYHVHRPETERSTDP